MDGNLRTAVERMIAATRERGTHCGSDRDFPDGYVKVPRAAWNAVVGSCPADDGEPWTGYWLPAVGAVIYAADPVLWGFVSFGNNGRVEFFRDGRVNVNGTAVECPTRGDVRLLLEGLNGGAGGRS